MCRSFYCGLGTFEKHSTICGDVESTGTANEKPAELEKYIELDKRKDKTMDYRECRYYNAVLLIELQR